MSLRFKNYIIVNAVDEMYAARPEHVANGDSLIFVSFEMNK